MTKMISIRFLMLAALSLLMMGGTALAQATGTVTGVVSDSTGAVVPNASIKLVSKATNQEKTITSNDDGIYSFTLLQPGQYTLTANAGNFAAQTLEVEVQVGRTTDANFTLGAGGVSAVVEVTAENIQTTQSNSDAVLNETAISNLPINGRRFQDFVTLTPSAQVEGSRGQISLSGQKGINGNVNVDGVDFNQTFFGGIRGGERSNQAFVIPQESIKEFQVIAAGYNAEYGRSTGGVINAVTKSGTNEVRGSAFYLVRPQRLARGNEYTQALQDQRLTALGVDATLAPTQHQFGGSIGGPIVREKFFYFASYEQQKFNAPRQVLIGNLIGLALPAGDRGLETFNFLRTLEESYEETNDAKALLGKVDWNITDAHRFNFRFNHARNDALNAVATGSTTFDPTRTDTISSNGIERNRNYISVGQLVSNFGAQAVNDFRFQYAKETRPREANVEAPNVFFGSAFAQYGSRNFLPTTQFDTRTQFIDSFNYITGNHIFKFGGEYSRIFAEQRFGFNQFGAYSLSTGGTTAILRNVALPGPPVPTLPALYLGRFDDTNARYARQIGNLQAGFRNEELAFFGQDQWRISPKLSVNYGLRVEQQYNPEPDTSNAALVNVVSNTRFPYYGTSYTPTIPDSGWQWGPRLGFAYDPSGDGKTVIRGYSGIYFARTPGLLFADSVNNYRATPGNVTSTLPFTGFSQTTFDTFAGSTAGANYRTITGCNPTAAAGTAARLACTPNTVFRQFAIAGINLNSSGLASLPNVTPAQLATIASGLGLSANPFVGATVTGHAADFKNPRSYQFGFAVEHQFREGIVIGADYSFVKTDRVQRNRDINIPGPLTGAQYIAFLQSANPTTFQNLSQTTIDTILNSGRTYIAQVTPGGLTFPGGFITTRQRPTNDPLLNPVAANRLALGSVQVRESSAKAKYHALTLRTRVVKRWGQLNAYYTLSSNKNDDDNERDSGGVAFANPYDMRNEYNYSRLDRTHQFVANPVFFLPWGFEASSAIRLRSGTPINTYIGTDANGDNVFNDRPHFVPGFELPRNFFRNRAIYDVDARVQKAFRFGETRKLTLSAEFFNVFNTPNIVFAFPGTNQTSGILAQYCAPGLATCGLGGGPTNINFLQIRERNPASTNFGNINLETRPNSGVFQMQLGARFHF